MNCFLLLLILSCCRCGNGCSCNSGRSGCGCRTEQRGCCRGAEREVSCSGCCNGMDSGRNDSCGRDMGRQADCCEREERRGSNGCGCEEEHHHDHDGCGCAERDSACDGPGMIPPPWQEYPQFPRRDRGEECNG